MRYPSVGRWVEVEDVLQGSLMRLLRALESVQPTSTRAFFGLAAEQMRRELLDLGRHFHGPHGIGANHASVQDDSGASRPRFEPLDPATTTVTLIDGVGSTKKLKNFRRRSVKSWD